MNSSESTASPDDAAFQTLLAVVHQMLPDTAGGDAKDFDTSQWLVTWTGQPVPALGGVTPASLMHTQDGVERVSDVLKSMASGAYR